MALKVLVVDDDFINRKLIQALLKRHPDLISQIVEAENGSEALQVMRENPDINLILLDILMPVLDGKEFLKIFRSDPENSKVPVIVLSTDDTQKSTVFDLGAEDFIIKPIAEEDLINRIRYWTQNLES
ncbi:response regulator [Nitratifractor sp.]|uniref:response regulator n=1 Tax=Nitratifractor sp. TaxID=2268144 RepID=UPI0025DF6CE8|nr:response regulator [Nitratifractor sp.]